ncbi:hypothetical protein SAMN04515671_0161 [Nakamurella panacisegetis]|uniref:Uncharacterized protein n=1 Tax=Nakamurella panacisegetis TaxID=1090615 RepID=A0A1H0HPZ2_9ACTN|nr:hypothetical protein SAMN04515671_0161 [Nakamurella panacisegetis]
MTITDPICARDHLSRNASVRPETAGPLSKVLKMNLMIENLVRDRMRRTQRDAELSRAADRLRTRDRQSRHRSS